MTLVTKSMFLTQVAGAIFNYKRYLTKIEFTRAVSEIINRYAFMGSPNQCGEKTVGNACILLFAHNSAISTIQGAIVQTLIGRFKELRQGPRPERGQSRTSPEEKPPAKKKPGMSISLLIQPPGLPDGEDETSMLSHASILRGEHDKGEQTLKLSTH